MGRERLEGQDLPARGAPSLRAAGDKNRAQRSLFSLDRTQTTQVLGFCGWVVAGGVTLFAIWELGNFEVLLGIEPSRPAVQEPAKPGVYRPAGDTSGGCTQAPIDRSGGPTDPADCHT